MQQLVLFQTGNIDFALDRNRISRIRPLPEESTDTTNRLQQKAIAVEGQDLLLIDLSADKGNHAAVSYPPKAEMIVVKESSYALFADHVKTTIDVNGKQVDELPKVFGGTARACFPKVLHLEDQVALIIDPDALEDVGMYAAKLRAIPKATSHGPEDNKKSPHTEKSPAPMQASSTYAIEDSMEAVVGKKLCEIISRRVKEVVAQTMARALKQQLH